MWNGRCDPHLRHSESVGSEGCSSFREQHVKGGTPEKDSEGYESGSEEGSVVLVKHVPEICRGGAVNDGPEGGELWCNIENDDSKRTKDTNHIKLNKKRKSKNAKRFSDIAKINRQILQSARRARRIRGEAKKNHVSINPMHIDNLITHEDEEAEKQQKDETDKHLPEPHRLTRRQAKATLQHLSQMLKMPITQLDPLLPSSKIYSYGFPPFLPHHPGLYQLDIIMIGWQNQQGQMTVGLELACAWVLAQQSEGNGPEGHGPHHPQIEQRLIAALDQLAYE